MLLYQWRFSCLPTPGEEAGEPGWQVRLLSASPSWYITLALLCPQLLSPGEMDDIGSAALGGGLFPNSSCSSFSMGRRRPSLGGPLRQGDPDVLELEPASIPVWSRTQAQRVQRVAPGLSPTCRPATRQTVLCSPHSPQPW